MKTIILEMTPSLTASIKTEMMCLKVKTPNDEIKHYFVEYPTNVPPDVNNLISKGNFVKELSVCNFNILKLAITSYIGSRQECDYLHTPTYIISFCNAKGYEILKEGLLL